MKTLYGGRPLTRFAGASGYVIAVVAVLLLVVGGVFALKRMTTGSSRPEQVSEPAPIETQSRLVAYVPDPIERNLSPIEIRAEASSSRERARAVIQGLIQYREQSSDEDSCPLPAGVRLLSVTLDGDTAIVNFSREFKDAKFWVGAEHSLLALQSVVYSLTEIEGIRKVQIQVDGKRVESLGGHEDVSEPLERDETVIPKRLAKDPKP